MTAAPVWLTPDIARAVNAPVTNLPGSRSPMALNEVLDQFAVETAERFRKRDYDGDGKAETFCNIYVSDVTRALFAEIPHQWEGKWMDVRAMAEWIRRGFGKWKRSDGWQAQFAADAGFPAIALHDPAARTHGHIAMLTPSEGAAGVLISQAGVFNYRRATLEKGFGKAARFTEFYTHE